MPTRTLLLVAVAACGPVVADDVDSGSGASEESSDGGATALDCSIPPGAIQARLVTGRGTPTIEVLSDDLGGELVPFTCDDPMPRCGYQVDRLAPAGDLVPSTFSVEADTLHHAGEFCGCCNGEDGGSDEFFGTFVESETTLVIEAASDACIIGRYDNLGLTVHFVAERCDF